MKAPKAVQILLSISLLSVTILAASASAAEKADYVFKNGAIYTIDSKNPTAQAIAIKGKLITYVGSNDGVSPFIGDTTRVTDLKGQMLLPGFVEVAQPPHVSACRRRRRFAVRLRGGGAGSREEVG